MMQMAKAGSQLPKGMGRARTTVSNQERHADQALAGPGEERCQARAQQPLGALDIGKRAAHDRLEVLS